MRSLGVDFVEYDIDRDRSRRDEARKISGGTSIPVIDIEGTVLRGYDPDAIRTALDQHAR